MKKKVLMVMKSLCFVAEVVMLLFNIDIFTRFLKEKRKEAKKVKTYKDNVYQRGYEAGYKDRDLETINEWNNFQKHMGGRND